MQKGQMRGNSAVNLENVTNTKEVRSAFTAAPHNLWGMQQAKKTVLVLPLWAEHSLQGQPLLGQTGLAPGGDRDGN